MQPAALDDHLHQVTDADGRNQPSFTGSDVQHCLRTIQEQTDSGNERVMARMTVHYYEHFLWKCNVATLKKKEQGLSKYVLKRIRAIARKKILEEEDFILVSILSLKTKFREKR